jgi:hypothetical protein
MHAGPDVYAGRFGGTSSVIYARRAADRVAFNHELTASQTCCSVRCPQRNCLATLLGRRD